MLSRVLSSAVYGIEAFLVEVEVDIANGLPAFNIVGLPDLACRESADRVRAALKNSGFGLPSKRITVNLAPADLKKEGAAFDLAIAIGILVADEILPKESVEGKIFCGELALDGKVRSVPGVLPRAVFLSQRNGGDRYDFFIPEVNAIEASFVKSVCIYPVKSVSDVAEFLKGTRKIMPLENKEQSWTADRVVYPDLDFADIKGQAHAKRAMEVAAAGGHNLLMIGPPGTGKTMLAKRLPSILPSPTFEEIMETTKIHSVAGLLSARSGLLDRRPFRDPHHTISDIAMVGGGKYPKPGEISLAHRGVLFLDEIPEFRRNVLEVLRQPLEEGRITIARASSTITLPARFMLVAAMNPCPCGYFTDPKRECSCTPLRVRNYLTKVSGPLFDRIDIQVEVPCLKVHEMTTRANSESSSAIRDRVEKAKSIQRQRYLGEKSASNSELGPKQLEKYCQATDEGTQILRMAIQELGFSARAYHKCLKVARTIADLEASERIDVGHITEAIHYRCLDKKNYSVL